MALSRLLTSVARLTTTFLVLGSVLVSHASGNGPELLPLSFAGGGALSCRADACATVPLGASLHVLTVVTDEEHSNFVRLAALARSLSFNLTALVAPPGSVHKGVGFKPKLTLVAAAVAALPDGDVVLFVDGYDTLLLARHPEQLLQAYNDALSVYGAPAGSVLFAAERNCWPDADVAASYPLCHAFPGSPYRFLNSGGYIGSVSALKRMLVGLDTLPSAVDDQRFFTHLYLSGTAGIVLDTGSLVFFCLAFGTQDAQQDEVVDGVCVWRNSATNSTPLVWHGNGYSVKFLFETIYFSLAPRPPATPHVFIGTPMYGGLAHAAHMRSVIDLVMLLRDEGVGAEWHYVAHQSLIPVARNMLVGRFLQCTVCTHLLFLDADIGFQAHDILAMLRLDKELVGAPYAKKGINWANVAAAARSDPGGDPRLLADVAGTYVINFPEGTANIKLGEPVEVKELGTGLLLIARSVFDKLAVAYPDRWYVPDEDEAGTRGGDAPVRLWAFFDAGVDPATGRYLSEDYFFCALWRALGGRVWMCPWVRTTHTGTFDFQGNLQAVASRLGRLVQGS